MANLQQRLQKAIEDGIKARSAYYASIELDDEQELGQPVPEALIAKLESRLGKALPPSYREFLLLHNGWKEIDGGLDLVPIEELLGERNQFDIPDWQTSMQKNGDTTAARSLVIGASHVTATKYLLDPDAIGPDGEWVFLQHHHEVEAEVPSFIEWLEQSVAEYEELALQDEPEDDD